MYDLPLPSIACSIAPLVAELRGMLGAKLVAYLGGVQETRAVRQWAEGTRNMPAETEARLRLAYHVAGIVAESNGHRVVQSWFQGMNPQLEDRAPARLIREVYPNQIGPELLAAARLRPARMKYAELDRRVWRVGFPPQPWERSDWRWAGADGRFNDRWDPLDHGLYRTIYAGESLLACLVELLAPHRPDQYLVQDLEKIVEDEDDRQDHPTVSPGELDLDQWLAHRVAASAHLRGRFIDITAAGTVLALHPRFKARALACNLKDVDVAALKSAEQRLLPQKDGTDFCDGIQFRSRHGDDLLLWAIYERDTDNEISSHVSDI